MDLTVTSNRTPEMDRVCVSSVDVWRSYGHLVSAT